ncbi:MAG: ABC transporter ATP-binding protein/permease [Defluviitaleaceae bacterium]|nr:ABC transporter ATP-binding protein/permease [Defluviitaleaceae bacterium]
MRRHGPHKEDKPKNFRGAIRRLLAYLGGEMFVITLTTIFMVVSTIMAVLAPRILGEATDEIFSGLIRMGEGVGGIDFSRIGQILLIMLVLHSLNIIFNYAQGYIMAGVAMRVMYRLRVELSDKIHRLPLKYFDKNPHGDVLSRISNDVDTLANTLGSGISQALMSAVHIIGTIIMMLTISPILTLVALITLPISAACTAFVVQKSQKYFKAQQADLGKLNGHIEEMFTAHAIVKAFNGEKKSVEAFDEHNKALYNASWRANFFSGMMMPIVGFISNIGYVAIVVIGGALTLNGAMTIGGIQAFIQYTRQLGHPIAQLAGVASVFQQTAAAAERVFDFLGEEEEDLGGEIFSTQSATQAATQTASGFESTRKDLHVPPEPKTLLKKTFVGRVEFKNVCFGYEPDTPVIKNFTAEVKPGQKIAIVGHTGAGKTTIVKLLMRFYDVASGGIFVDGKNITEYERDELRRHFGMVLQDTWLFSGTIAENIRYGRLDASDEDVKNAARAAQAHHFIRVLPDGYGMQINEEADNISAGQKQLLTIARTILANPDILILDEATSNVDTRTEIQIQRAMDNLMQGRTSFIIAHRLSTIRSADLILVMRDGDIAEQGTHDGLLAAGGVYEKLYRSQFEESA